MKLFNKFIKEEDGATIIEYVLMLAIVAGIVMFAFPSLRNAIGNWISGLFGNIDSGLSNDELQYTCDDGRKVDDLSNC